MKDTAKVGSNTVKKGPISTPYKDCAVAKPGQAGAGVSVRNGIDIPGGAKGTGGEMDEVTLVDMHGAPSKVPVRKSGYNMSGS